MDKPESNGSSQDLEMARLVAELGRLKLDHQKALENLEAMNAVLTTVVAHDSQEEEEFSVELHLAQAQAARDPLTQLYNRLGFQKLFIPALEVAEAQGSALSLVMVDIDHFKRINDIYGHDAGDRVLLAVSACLREGSSEGSSVARWGGEEFLVLVPGVDAVATASLAETLRDLVANTAIANAEAVTCSCGVSQHRSLEPAGEFLKRVDEALYAAKEGGRNQVQVR